MGEINSIVVIGGVAAGMSAASQAKRRRPHAHVTVLEKGSHISYGACGMPYVLGDPDLYTMGNLQVLTPGAVRDKRGIDLHLRTEVTRIDVDRRAVFARDLDSGEELRFPYDRLVIATGARAFVPPITGVDSPGVFPLRNLGHGQAMEAYLATRDPKSAILVGAGFIGMELAETLTERGLKVTVIERLEQVVPGFAGEIADEVRAKLEAHGVDVRTGVNVERIEVADGPTHTVTTSVGELTAEMVVVAVGVRPNSEIAKAAGIEVGASGAIAIDDRCQTSTAGVYAAGDCAEAYHRVLDGPAWIPLGTTANKQGKVAGAQAAGADVRFGGIVGTMGFKVFDLEVARTGLGPTDLERLGRPFLVAASKQGSKAHPFKSAPIRTVLTLDPDTGELLGAQMVGAASVAKRIDVFATALWAKLPLDEIAALDLSYAPPLAPVWDPILIAATVAQKVFAKSRND